jgi:thiol-disulfide isomerase/thioredoxin
MKRLFTSILVLSALFLQTASAKDVTLTFELKENGAPTLHIKETQNGIAIDEYKGKVLLLNFFGKRCKWCMKEIPQLVELQKKHKEKFQIVAIHAQQPMTLGERSMLEKRFSFNYPIYEYMNNQEFVQYISHRARWSGGLPFSIIFDSHGSAAKIIPGYASKGELEKIIDFLVKQK